MRHHKSMITGLNLGAPPSVRTVCGTTFPGDIRGTKISMSDFFSDHHILNHSQENLEMSMYEDPLHFGEVNREGPGLPNALPIPMGEKCERRRELGSELKK